MTEKPGAQLVYAAHWACCEGAPKRRDDYAKQRATAALPTFHTRCCDSVMTHIALDVLRFRKRAVGVGRLACGDFRWGEVR